MREIYNKIINQEKLFYINTIKYCLPQKTSEFLRINNNWGDLEKYKGKKYSLDEINNIISEIIKRQPYISSSMFLEIYVCYSIGTGEGCHTSLRIFNYYYELEDINENAIIIIFRN
jgi:hypothetical protein